MTQPQFIPRPGQIDYSNIRWVPVINCVLRYNETFLLVQRSKDLRLYPGCWNGVSGFLDDQKSIDEKVREEIQEELGMSPSHITSITTGQIFIHEDPVINKSWIVQPVLVDVDSQAVVLDWEASSFRWVSFEEIQRLDLLPGFQQVIRSIDRILHGIK